MDDSVFVFYLKQAPVIPGFVAFSLFKCSG